MSTGRSHFLMKNRHLISWWIVLVLQLLLLASLLLSPDGVSSYFCKYSTARNTTTTTIPASSISTNWPCSGFPPVFLCCRGMLGFRIWVSVKHLEKRLMVKDMLESLFESNFFNSCRCDSYMYPLPPLSNHYWYNSFCCNCCFHSTPQFLLLLLIKSKMANKDLYG